MDRSLAAQNEERSTVNAYDRARELQMRERSIDLTDPHQAAAWYYRNDPKALKEWQDNARRLGL